MSNQVYANDMEVSCKAADGKTICAMPDVCMTPPQTPATPPGVPVPYPNTGMASDCSDGSSSVKISGQEVMLKNQSYFKKSIGDEAGSAPMKGVITATNRGKVYFIAWSMDVKAEGENVVRHLDMTTGNHACPTPNEAAPFTYAQRMALGNIKECKGDKEKVKTACKIDPDNPDDAKKRPECPSGAAVRKAERARAVAKKRWGKGSDAWKNANKKVTKEYGKFATSMKKNKCQQALKCFLGPQKPSRCCKKQTPHHLIPASAIVRKGGRKGGGGESVLASFTARTPVPDYQSSKAPCICVEGPNQQTATHGKAHRVWADHMNSLDSKSGDLAYNTGKDVKNASVVSYGDAVKGAKKTAKKVAPHCNPACIAAQVNQGHLGKTEATEADNETMVRRTMGDEDGTSADSSAN